MPPTQINRSCVITRRTAIETRNALGQESRATETLETVCELQQRSSSEGSVDETVSSEWAAFLYPVVDSTWAAAGNSLWVVGEGDFEIVGEPNRLRNRRTQDESHIELNLSRTGGPEDDPNESEGS